MRAYGVRRRWKSIRGMHCYYVSVRSETAVADEVSEILDRDDTILPLQGNQIVVQADHAARTALHIF